MPRCFFWQRQRSYGWDAPAIVAGTIHLYVVINPVSLYAANKMLALRFADLFAQHQRLISLYAVLHQFAALHQHANQFARQYVLQFARLFALLHAHHLANQHALLCVRQFAHRLASLHARLCALHHADQYVLLHVSRCANLLQDATTQQAMNFAAAMASLFQQEIQTSACLATNTHSNSM